MDLFSLHRFPNYREEFTRCTTFPRQWDFRYSKAELAENGFISVDGSSWVVCFSCGLEINVQVDNRDTLLVQHSTKSASCSMVTGNHSINIPLPHKTIYKCEKDRLYSFLISHFPWPVDVYSLAKDGFYYDQGKRSSCCFECKLQIGSWTQGDTSASEHSKYSPNCRFYLNGEGVENVPLGQEDTPLGRQVVQSSFSEGTAPFISAVHVVERPKIPKYKESKDRLDTFSTWPASMKQRPGELADAGFFYTSRGDLVQCYQCGGGFKFWGREDVPWEQHAIAFPECPLVRALAKTHKTFLDLKRTKSSTIVAMRNPNHPDQEQETKIEIDGEGASSMATAGAGGEVKEVRLCKVCLTNELGIVFLPCAHMVTCPECAPQLTSCPICRSKFSAYVRSFLP
ncbi:baculoviral IAP repeat-containing protein 2-like [Cloeon dipterum]|uniref:baculoviral IAP repeat-containing protein 2-like n=1 Tax=Cloeon dipterum TaxID=197152 RepID=UPI00322036C1